MDVDGTNQIVNDGDPLMIDPLDNDDPDQETISPIEQKSKILVERALQPDFSKALEAAIAYCSEHETELYRGEAICLIQSKVFI